MGAGSESCVWDSIAARRLRDGEVSCDVFLGVWSRAVPSSDRPSVRD